MLPGTVLPRRASPRFLSGQACARTPPPPAWAPGGLIDHPHIGPDHPPDAQAIRANLLANATTAVLPCALASRPRNQTLNAFPSSPVTAGRPARPGRSACEDLLRRLVIPRGPGLSPVGGLHSQ